MLQSGSYGMKPDQKSIYNLLYYHKKKHNLVREDTWMNIDKGRCSRKPLSLFQPSSWQEKGFTMSHTPTPVCTLLCICIQPKWMMMTDDYLRLTEAKSHPLMSLQRNCTFWPGQPVAVNHSSLPPSNRSDWDGLNDMTEWTADIFELPSSHYTDGQDPVWPARTSSSLMTAQ